MARFSFLTWGTTVPSLPQTPFSLLLIFFLSSYAHAQDWSLQAGISALEEGDDRYRPGILLHAGYLEYSARYSYFEQSFGPVRQRTHILNVTRSFSIPEFDIVAIRLGLSPLLEHTRIQFPFEKDESFNRNEFAWNLGACLGVFWELKESNGFRIQAAWDISLYPAGFLGGILLATGRKQLISISAGMAL